MPSRNKFSLSLILDVLKWGLVVWLMWPLLSFQMEKMTIWRMVFGVLLAVLFLGKMFYDIILDNFKQKKERYTLVDLLVLVGFISIIAVLIGGAILVIGMYVTSQMQESVAQ